jgi:hypothetical protein
MLLHQEGVKEHLSVGTELRGFQSQLPLADAPSDPRLVKTLEAFAMKPPAACIEEFEIFGDGHDILVPLPLRTDLEVAQNLARHIGFKRPFHYGPETLSRPPKLGVWGGDIQELETPELPKEPLIGGKMRSEIRRCFKARIDVMRIPMKVIRIPN